VPYAAFTPAQQVARNLMLIVARNKLRNTQLDTGNKQLAARNMMLVARNKLRVTAARNKLRWCKRGIRLS